MRTPNFTKALVAASAIGTANAGLSTSSAALFRNFGWHLREWNVGMMTALMANLDNTSSNTTCVIAADLTSIEVMALLDFENYLNGGFNLGTFLTSINVVFIRFMDQTEACGVNELFIQWDNIMSNWSDLAGVVTNLAIMIGTGWADKNTSPFIVYDHWVLGWNNKDFREFGIGFQLLFASLAKFDAPDLQVEVSVMGLV